MEKWLPVKGYEGRYEVSDGGRVRTVARWIPNGQPSGRHIAQAVLAPFRHSGGYSLVKLSRDRKKTNQYVHRLVAAAFCGPPTGAEVLHHDGDKTNNSAENLSWGSRADNVADRKRLGEFARGERHGHAKLTSKDVLAAREDSRTHAVVAAELGVSRGLIRMIRERRVWVHI